MLTRCLREFCEKSHTHTHKMLQHNRNICFIFIDLDSKKKKSDLLKGQVSERARPGDLGWSLHMLSLDRDLWVEEEEEVEASCDRPVVRAELIPAGTAAGITRSSACSALQGLLSFFFFFLFKYHRRH